MSSPFAPPPRSLLYVPAANARALEKARGLDADMLVIDLEDSVPPEAKAVARVAAVDQVAAGFPGKLISIRLNGLNSPELAEDLAAVVHDVDLAPRILAEGGHRAHETRRGSRPPAVSSASGSPRRSAACARAAPATPPRRSRCATPCPARWRTPVRSRADC
ncbi:MAG: hypothetical protein HC788_08205 [Sphingopyxis sp.]|nr:hypothetical protein [Sphingopyxis sp.]